jgi:hypothetical protein
MRGPGRAIRSYRGTAAEGMEAELVTTTGDPYADALLDDLDATAEEREFEREWWERHDETVAALD